MSYNGIGLPTPRGSGTNGYVMKNLSYVKRRAPYEMRSLQKLEPKKSIDPSISEHEQKRLLESKVLAYREELQESGKTDEEIKALVSAFRQRLSNDSHEDSHRGKRNSETRERIRGHSDRSFRNDHNLSLDSSSGHESYRSSRRYERSREITSYRRRDYWSNRNDTRVFSAEDKHLDDTAEEKARPVGR
ncbi:complexed with Cdc5 protein Cwf21 [Schizosaccharomyces japonicus yFS275]|uniref:Complexed with Cdc5 protein Cwf21 n=1 Tax=Schizosaccharomyces japonicus (strain yFS275 / FY16936) TaxID=402676 RepID=B6K894_SCHJY|nr:complexed with Cdc5 protein Cwf21 [Schizosaccharomyces japonicus yFS275]EEB09748.2 complexed with Cdc5 protein Cwf21 [Schizosaccharomyces japonicus yFS275]